MALIDFTVEIDLDVDSAADAYIDFTVDVELEVVTRSTGTARRMVLVDMDGVTLAEGVLDNAVMGPITWEPSKTTTWAATVPAADDKVDAILGTPSTGDYGIGEPFRECQLYRGDRLLTWGPVVGAQMNGAQLELAGADVGFYYDRRRIGPATRPNLLVNADLSSGLQGWWSLVTNPPYSFTVQSANAKIETGWVPGAAGKRGLKITNTTADDSFSEPFAAQIIRSGAYAYPHRWSFSATMWPEAWQRPNPRKSGIGIAVMPIGWDNWYTDAGTVAWATVDETFSREGPQHLEVGVTVGNALEYDVVFLVTAPKGVVWVYDLMGDMEGGLEFNDGQGYVAMAISDHISANPNSPYPRATHGLLWPYSLAQESDKSNLKIGAVTDNTGPTRQRRYFYGAGTTGSQALAEFSQLDDGFEYGFRFTPSTRSLETHHPQMGRYRPKMPLRYTAAGGNIVTYSWSFEGGQAANRITVQGASQLGYNRYGEDLGAGRSFATASDASSFANSVTIEELRNAPADVDDQALAGYASRRLDQATRPVVLQVRIAASPWFDQGLFVGDRVPVRIVDGAFSVDDVMRITKMTLTPDDWLDLTLSPWPGGAS